MCHVHECVDEGDFEKKGEEILAAMQQVKPNWIARIEKVEKVKKYAPRVWHLVYDVVLRPPMKMSLKEAARQKSMESAGRAVNKEKSHHFAKVLRSHRPKTENIQAMTRNREPVVLTGIDI